MSHMLPERDGRAVAVVGDQAQHRRETPVMLWVPAYVALGSNLDGPERQVEIALARLAGIVRTQRVAISRLYASRPLGPQDQPSFVNAAAGLLTQLSARELLGELQGHRA